MSHKRPTEASWDSDDDLLCDDLPGITAFSKTKKDDSDDELLDEDALLESDDETNISVIADADTSQIINTSTTEYYPNAEYTEPHYAENDSNTQNDSNAENDNFTQNYNHAETTAEQDSLVEIDLSVKYDELAEFGDGDLESDIGSQASGAVQGGQSYSHQTTTKTADTSLFLQGMQDSEQLPVPEDTEVEEVSDVSLQKPAYTEDDSESDDDEDKTKRGRFESERSHVVSLSSSVSRTSNIPDTLEITDEQQAQIDNFMVNSGKRKGNRGKFVSKRGRPGQNFLNQPHQQQQQMPWKNTIPVVSSQSFDAMGQGQGYEQSTAHNMPNNSGHYNHPNPQAMYNQPNPQMFNQPNPQAVFNQPNTQGHALLSESDTAHMVQGNYGTLPPDHHLPPDYALTDLPNTFSASVPTVSKPVSTSRTILVNPHFVPNKNSQHGTGWPGQQQHSMTAPQTHSINSVQMPLPSLLQPLQQPQQMSSWPPTQQRMDSTGAVVSNYQMQGATQSQALMRPPYHNQSSSQRPPMRPGPPYLNQHPAQQRPAFMHRPPYHQQTPHRPGIVHRPPYPTQQDPRRPVMHGPPHHQVQQHPQHARPPRMQGPPYSNHPAAHRPPLRHGAPPYPNQRPPYPNQPAIPRPGMVHGGSYQEQGYQDQNYQRYEQQPQGNHPRPLLNTPGPGNSDQNPNSFNKFAKRKSAQFNMTHHSPTKAKKFAGNVARSPIKQVAQFNKNQSPSKAQKRLSNSDANEVIPFKVAKSPVKTQPVEKEPISDEPVDEETRILNLKIAEQKKLREKIIKQKEAKRHLVAVQKQKEIKKKLAAKGITMADISGNKQKTETEQKGPANVQQPQQKQPSGPRMQKQHPGPRMQKQASGPRMQHQHPGPRMQNQPPGPRMQHQQPRMQHQPQGPRMQNQPPGPRMQQQHQGPRMQQQHPGPRMQKQSTRPPPLLNQSVNPGNRFRAPTAPARLSFQTPNVNQPRKIQPNRGNRMNNPRNSFGMNVNNPNTSSHPSTVNRFNNPHPVNINNNRHINHNNQSISHKKDSTIIFGQRNPDNSGQCLNRGPGNVSGQGQTNLRNVNVVNQSSDRKVVMPVKGNRHVVRNTDFSHGSNIQVLSERNVLGSENPTKTMNVNTNLRKVQTVSCDVTKSPKRVVIPKKTVLKNSNNPSRVCISNLSASTSRGQLEKLCKSVGNIENIHLDSQTKTALIDFSESDHAAVFTKKFNRYMLDLSHISVSLVRS